MAEVRGGGGQEPERPGAPKACGILMELEKEKRETLRVKLSVNKTRGWLG